MQYVYGPVLSRRLGRSLGTTPSLVAIRVAGLMVKGVIESRLHRGRFFYTANRAVYREAG